MQERSSGIAWPCKHDEAFEMAKIDVRHEAGDRLGGGEVLRVAEAVIPHPPRRLSEGVPGSVTVVIRKVGSGRERVHPSRKDRADRPE